MLFPYLYLSEHSIYKLQKWIDQIFLDVWCQADPAIDYNIDLLPDEIKEITLEIYNDDRITTDYFYGPIDRVYKIFQSIDQPTKDALAKHYNDNNAIEDLCKVRFDRTTLLYGELGKLNASLKIELEWFFRNLFDSVIDLKCVQKRIGTIDNHYKDFVKLNNNGICPVCGLLPIDNEYDQTRDAYDHYLPKSKYPFNSVNFTNLAPICHKCNSINKGADDPLHWPSGKRRKAFYLYCNEQHNIEMFISINVNDVFNLKLENIELEFGPQELSEELQTWDELFGITKRYKATCLGADGRYWITQILDEFKHNGTSVKEALRKKISESERSPFNEKNFLRKPFLEACKAQHVFE